MLDANTLNAGVGPFVCSTVLLCGGCVAIHMAKYKEVKRACNPPPPMVSGMFLDLGDAEVNPMKWKIATVNR